MAAALHETITLNSVHPWLKRNDTPVESCPNVVSYTHDTGSGPVLFLIHGYPQSAFIWRHVAPLLQSRISLFIPEIPGYGISSPPNLPITFSTMGLPLLQAFQTLFPSRPLILGGHDRGARIAHRLAIDLSHSPSPSSPLDLRALILLDIVPTLVQWSAFASAKASTAYFHWPLLASPLGPEMILAYGGAEWTRAALDRIGGGNEAARAAFRSDRAWEVYESLFATEGAVRGSCEDYKAGAMVEPGLQERDQGEGRKVEVPTLVGWSERGLGGMHGDVGEIWKRWVREGVRFRGFGCGDGVGHYLPEEAAGKVAGEIGGFLDEVLGG
ncbi:alpha/beta hydrolase [Elsinoe ampelina]|uniref:Alpha/beta hydrolase n=1 Tax=Elsinoe ampelina TaxID=302913 RepID=A0A6A6GJH1_9PEZI|nr:alpha/beta hydrolase [Elsinoe ampelina]